MLMVSMTNDKQDAEQQRDQTSTSASMDQVRRLHADMNRQDSRTVDELRLLNMFCLRGAHNESEPDRCRAGRILRSASGPPA
jgi:hypothetical protein